MPPEMEALCGTALQGSAPLRKRLAKLLARSDYAIRFNDHLEHDVRSCSSTHVGWASKVDGSELFLFSTSSKVQPKNTEEIAHEEVYYVRVVGSIAGRSVRVR